jgi:hypothetical protein
MPSRKWRLFYFKRPDACARKRKTRNMNNCPIVAVRRCGGNDNHHIWNNHGTWWCALTLHLPDFTKKRLRLSLDTRDEKQARRLRDGLVALFGGVVAA